MSFVNLMTVMVVVPCLTMLFSSSVTASGHTNNWAVLVGATAFARVKRDTSRSIASPVLVGIDVEILLQLSARSEHTIFLSHV